MGGKGVHNTYIDKEMFFPFPVINYHITRSEVAGSPPLCSYPMLKPTLSMAFASRFRSEFCRQVREGPDPNITAWLPLVLQCCQLH